jgi:hypothetical protein
MRPHVDALVRMALISAVLFMVLAGCTDGAAEFKIRFNDVHGLRKGAPVYFDENVIGAVREIDYTDEGVFLVSVAIRKAFASDATDASRFYIDRDPEKGSQKVIRMVQLKPGGRPIAEDAVVDGQTRYAVLYEQFARELGQNIAALESGIEAFLNELQGFPADEQIAELEQQLDAIIADLGTMSHAMKDKLEHEILPLIREKIEDLRKRLAGSGRENALEPLDRKLHTIHERLNV